MEELAAGDDIKRYFFDGLISLVMYASVNPGDGWRSDYGDQVEEQPSLHWRQCCARVRCGEERAGGFYSVAS